MKLLKKLLVDQGIHQSFVAVGSHEALDGIIYAILVFLVAGGLSPFWVIGAWLISFTSGIALGHFMIEFHNRHDANLHRRMAEIKDESWLFDD